MSRNASLRGLPKDKSSPPKRRILHEISSSLWNPRMFSWWAVDTETLTLARCSIRNRYRLRVNVARPPDGIDPAMDSHQSCKQVGEAAIALLAGCRLRFNYLSDAPGLLGHAANDLPIPEYILLGNGGIPHAILHTLDPRFIASFIDGRVARPMGNLLVYRSNVDLPPSGWEYWSTDAYQEFERMSQDYTQCGIPFLENCR
jgi:hypothetical protein